jgi:hypothetical protein
MITTHPVSTDPAAVPDFAWPRVPAERHLQVRADQLGLCSRQRNGAPDERELPVERRPGDDQVRPVHRPPDGAAHDLNGVAVLDLEPPAPSPEIHQTLDAGHSQVPELDTFCSMVVGHRGRFSGGDQLPAAASTWRRLSSHGRARTSRPADHSMSKPTNDAGVSQASRSAIRGDLGRRDGSSPNASRSPCQMTTSPSRKVPAGPA